MKLKINLGSLKDFVRDKVKEYSDPATHYMTERDRIDRANFNERVDPGEGAKKDLSDILQHHIIERQKGGEYNLASTLADKARLEALKGYSKGEKIDACEKALRIIEGNTDEQLQQSDYNILYDGTLGNEIKTWEETHNTTLERLNDKDTESFIEADEDTSSFRPE